MSSDPWVRGNLQERIGYNPDLLSIDLTLLDAIITQASYELKQPYQGQYPLPGALGIAILAETDYKDCKVSEDAYLAILDIESDNGDFMIQFTANGMTLPWTRVGRKTALMKPIGVRRGLDIRFKTDPPDTHVQLWGFVIGTAGYLRNRNIKETPRQSASTIQTTVPSA